MKRIEKNVLEVVTAMFVHSNRKKCIEPFRKAIRLKSLKGISGIDVFDKILSRTVATRR